MATLSIVQGFLAAGKSTFSRRLAEENRMLRLNADETCEALFPQTQLENDWDACYAKAVNILWHRAKTHLEEGKDVVLDFGFWDKASRDYARAVAKDVKAEFCHYYLETPEAVMKQRLTTRKGTIAEQNIARFLVLKQAFEVPGPDEQAALVIIKS